MTATASQTKPSDQPAMVETVDTQDVDALLAQADALAEEAAQAVAGEPQAGDELSAQPESRPVELAIAPEGSDRADQNVNPSAGIGSTLDDLDTLLQELAEKAPVEAEAQPADADTAQPAAESAPADGGADPHAGEVARAEQPSPGDATAGGETALEDAVSALEQAQATATADEFGEAPIERSRSLPARIAYPFAAAAVGGLAVMDIPFARLSPRIKNVLGYVAVATLVVAAGLWLAGPSLIHH